MSETSYSALLHVYCVETVPTQESRSVSGQIELTQRANQKAYGVIGVKPQEDCMGW